MTTQLAFDFTAPDPAAGPILPHEGGRRTRVHRGTTGYHAGVSAELRVAQDYERRGYTVLRSRWRGLGGEIDLIIADGDAVIFVEVKKSRSFDRALERLSRRQILRLFSAAEEFVGTLPGGSLTEMRFDVALMDERGMIRIMEGALML
ncbi:YraN family protein [Citreicella sp. C3M06]|uniref:YraN family protein n=1 Tax=Citreicella sp. C3M06 TaxID=2841564 RepID=UPI001C096126|nr:YraN family protein [Citreicella sp. C3M06]MBU2963817.1 YraN family protein [Citreicella sp. C3M06]